MDRGRFDALTRVLGTEGSRRTALGAMLGAMVLGTSGVAGAKKKGKKSKKKAVVTTCFGTEICVFPGPALDFENCNFAGTDVCDYGNCSGSNFRGADLGNAYLKKGNFQGASFRAANLRFANLKYADVSGASFRDACLVGANFDGANVDGAHFEGAILCGTILANGDIDDSGCALATGCCLPGCINEHDCPSS